MTTNTIFSEESLQVGNLVKEAIALPVRLSGLAMTFGLYINAMDVGRTMTSSVQDFHNMVPLLAGLGVAAVGYAAYDHFLTADNLKKVGSGLKDFGNNICDAASSIGSSLGLTKAEGKDLTTVTSLTDKGQEALSKTENDKGSFWAKTAVDSMRHVLGPVMLTSGIVAGANVVLMPFLDSVPAAAAAAVGFGVVTAATYLALNKLNDKSKELTDREGRDVVDFMMPKNWGSVMDTLANVSPEKRARINEAKAESRAHRAREQDSLEPM